MLATAPKIVFFGVIDSMPRELAAGANGRLTGLPNLTGHGVDYSNVIATSSWTGPTHAAMFTGRTPHELRFDLDSDNRDLHPDAVTIAQIARTRGYKTHSIPANIAPSIFALDRGFDQVRRMWKEVPDLNLRTKIVSRALAALNNKKIREKILPLLRDPTQLLRLFDPERAGKSAFEKLIGDKGAARMASDFLASKAWYQSMAEEQIKLVLEILEKDPDSKHFFFVNFMEAHFPYHIGGAFEFATPGGIFNPRSWLEELPGLYHMVNQSYLVDGKDHFAPTQHELMKARQRAAWERFTEIFNDFVPELDRHGDAMIVLASDHGEKHGDAKDEGEVYHFHGLGPSVTDTLLVIRPSNAAYAGARIVNEPASNRQIFHTLLNAMNAGNPDSEALDLVSAAAASFPVPDASARWYDNMGKTQPQRRFNHYKFVTEKRNYVYRWKHWLEQNRSGTDRTLQPLDGDPIEDAVPEEKRAALRASFQDFLKFSKAVNEG